MGMVFSAVDYRGRVFADFHARKDPSFGPGWFIFGRNAEYDGRLVRNCGRPDVKPRKHPHYNGRVYRGWATKRACQAAIASM